MYREDFLHEMKAIAQLKRYRTTKLYEWEYRSKCSLLLKELKKCESLLDIGQAYLPKRGAIMNKGNLLFIFALIIPIPVLAVTQHWFMLSVLLIFYVGLIGMELVAIHKTGKTISTRFHEWSDNNKTKGWLVMASFIVAWLGLTWHLAFRLLN